MFFGARLGSIEYGRLLWTQQALQQAAIAGAMHGDSLWRNPKQLLRVRRHLQLFEHEDFHRDHRERMGLVGP
jgi:hypothetical protein